MKKFSPKMTDGMGGAKDMAPEAVAEWKDQGGQHSSPELSPSGVASAMTPSKSGGPDSFDPGAGVKSHEKAQVAKSKSTGGGSPFPKIGSGGPKSGPMKGAGKGAEGSTKGAAGAGKFNTGNGLKKGAGKK